MEQGLFGCLLLLLIIHGPMAHAGENSPAPGNWNGSYAGAHIGGMRGTTTFSDPLGASIYGDDVRQPAFLGGLQLGHDWQAPASPRVFGLESSVSILHSNGSNTCLAYSGRFLSANCENTLNLGATFTGRAGFAPGERRRTLFFLRAGLAGIYNQVGIATNPIISPPFETAASPWHWGGLVGIGVETHLSPVWSLRFEYDYMDFNGSDVATPAGELQTTPEETDFVWTPRASTHVSNELSQLRLAVNRHFGTAWRSRDRTLVAMDGTNLAAVSMGGWKFNAGIGYWYSWSRFQKDLSYEEGNKQGIDLASRLTYVSTVDAREFHVSLESPGNVFVRALVGKGSVGSGHMNDEDWLLDIDNTGTVPYSNTVSPRMLGEITYAALDVGYDMFRSPAHRLGVFVGYNYYQDDKRAYGCIQLAYPSAVCPEPLANSVLGISESNTWKSFRFGLSGKIAVKPAFTLGLDVALLPETRFYGVDVHHLRTDITNLVSPEFGAGHGVQVEARLVHHFTPALQLGVGGRYWAQWVKDNAYVNIFGTDCPCQALPSKAERFGLFLQAVYSFGRSGTGIHP